MIFTFPAADAGAHLQHWIDTAGRPQGAGFTRGNFEAHVRDEFSTYAWVLEGMLQRAGFEVVATDFPKPTHGEFVCRVG